MLVGISCAIALSAAAGFISWKTWHGIQETKSEGRQSANTAATSSDSPGSTTANQLSIELFLEEQKFVPELVAVDRALNAIELRPSPETVGMEAARNVWIQELKRIDTTTSQLEREWSRGIRNN